MKLALFVVECLTILIYWNMNCRTITWKKLSKCVIFWKNLMKIMEYAHPQFLVCVNIFLQGGENWWKLMKVFYKCELPVSLHWILFNFSLNFFCILVQCILFSLVYVKPRNKLCHNRSKSSSKPTEVSSFLFAWMRLRVINICFKPSISDCIAFYLYTSNCKCFYIGNVVSNINRSDTQSDVPYHLSRNFKCLHPCFLTYNIRSQFHPKRERNKRSERKTHK